MNRPPRKKKPNEPSPDHQAQPPGADDAPATGTSQDDRNLVNIDQAFQEADVEDKVWLFWERNKVTLIGGAVLILVAVLGVEGYRYYQRQSEVALQESYQEARLQNTLEAFGEKHARTQLGAFALLTAADKHYENLEYAEAASLYAEAENGLKGTVFAGRALLGQGMSLLKAGEPQKGVAKLNLLTSDSGALDSVRAEAAFNLALLAMENEDYAEARRWLQTIERFPTARIWAQQAEIMANNTPELALEEEETAIGETVTGMGQSGIAVSAENEPTLPPEPAEAANAENSPAAEIPTTDTAEDAE